LVVCEPAADYARTTGFGVRWSVTDVFERVGGQIGPASGDVVAGPFPEVPLRPLLPPSRCWIRQGGQASPGGSPFARVPAWRRRLPPRSVSESVTLAARRARLTSSGFCLAGHSRRYAAPRTAADLGEAVRGERGVSALWNSARGGVGAPARKPRHIIDPRLLNRSAGCHQRCAEGCPCRTLRADARAASTPPDPGVARARTGSRAGRAGPSRPSPPEREVAGCGCPCAGGCCHGRPAVSVACSRAAAEDGESAAVGPWEATTSAVTRIEVVASRYSIRLDSPVPGLGRLAGPVYVGRSYRRSGGSADL
jgi:hypothetical protein